MKTPQTMPAALEALLLSGYPSGTRILSTHTYRPGDRSYPVRIRTPEGSTTHCVVKIGERIELIEREARVLGALAELDFPVPTVLAGPLTVTDQPGTYAAMALSELPGRPLPWLGTTSLAEADLTCRLLIQGVDQLHQLTERVSRHDIATILPRTTLSAELNAIVELGGEWLEVDLFVRAVAYLRTKLDDIQIPLAFSNGDYNPLNFLHDGTSLTGYVDFEHACFEDPHACFAKFLKLSFDEYGWGTGVKAGLVERYLYTQGVSRREFVPRLVLRCLRRLHREVSATGDVDAIQRRHMLNVLQEAAV